VSDAEQVDHEDERLAGQAVSAAGRAVGELRRADELTASADLHAGDALLPGADQLRERELRRLATVPGRVELLAGVELDADVVDVHESAGNGLRAVADDEVGDGELGGRGALDEVDVRLVSHADDPSTWPRCHNGAMRATILHAPRDIRLEDVAVPQICLDTDAVVRVVASCICGSDLWPYRGVKDTPEPVRIGHEFVGIVEQVGSAVSTLKPGDFVIAPFNYSDNTCQLCLLGVHSSCVNGGFWGNDDKQGQPVDGGQGEIVRVPWADGTLVATPSEPSQEMVAQLLTLSDVFPTGHHAAISAGVTQGSTVAVVGDGAVGLSAILAAKRLGASRIVAMSRHEDRQRLARQFGADEVVAERGPDGAAQVREILDGIGADCVLECVGTGDSMKQAMFSARPGARVGYVGVPHDVSLNVFSMFARNIGLVGGVAPVRAYIDDLLPDVLDGTITPGDVFDLTVPLDRVADGYRAMDERTAVKTMLTT